MTKSRGIGKGRYRVARIPTCHPDAKHGALGLCEPCYQRAYREAHPGLHNRRVKRWEDRHPGRSRFRRYGITQEQYDAMVAAQGGVCLICRQPPSGKRATLAIDHDHSTGRVRALLCTRCNAGIGQFRERPDVMYRAIRYLYDQQTAAEMAA